MNTKIIKQQILQKAKAGIMKLFNPKLKQKLRNKFVKFIINYLGNRQPSNSEERKKWEWACFVI